MDSAREHSTAQRTRLPRRMALLLAMASIVGALLLLGSAGCQFSHDPRTQDPGEVSFNAERAWSDLETVVGFGPRPPGSEALEQLRGFIRTQLTAAGVDVREHAFVAQTPLGPTPPRPPGRLASPRFSHL